MHDFLLAFIPLFVAVDVVALVPIYLGIGMPLDEAARRRLVLEATLTAAAVGLGFLLIGDAVLYFLGVTVGDFQVAGGLLLLVLSIYVHFGTSLHEADASPGGRSRKTGGAMAVRSPSRR